MVMINPDWFKATATAVFSAEAERERLWRADAIHDPNAGILVVAEIARIRLRWVAAVDIALEVFVDRIDKHGHRPPDLAVIRHQRG